LLGRGHRLGAPSLRDALGAWQSDDSAVLLESMLEVEVLRLLLRAGLPVPTCQHEVALPAGGRAFFDFAWPARRVGLEVDGFRFHADRRHFDSDRRRGNELVAMGWQVLHTTAAQVRERPRELLATVTAALG
jgi:hypothetical protein